MNHIPFCVLFMALLLMPYMAAAQAVLEGIVTYQNTGVAQQAIQVTARGASPVVTKASSNSEGRFKLEFPDKQPGDAVVLDIANRTYELVNHARELQVVIPKAPKEKQVRLVVCKKGERDQNAVKYYEISTQYLEESYLERQAELTTQIELLKQDIIAKEGNASQLQTQVATLEQEKAALTQSYEAQLENAWTLSEDFARVDLAQANEIYQEAFGLFQDGEIEQARALLRGTRRQENLQNIRQLKGEIANEEDNIKEIESAVERQKKVLKEKKAEAEKVIDQEIQNYLLEARLAQLAFDFDSVEVAYQGALALDATNLDVLWNYANYLDEQNAHPQAIELYNLALDIADTESERSAFMNNLGNLYSDTQALARADSVYQEALSTYRALAEQNPAAYLPYVATTLNNLGLLYADTQALARADSVYQEALSTYRALAEQNPAAYLPDVAMTLNNLGLLYADTQALARADSVYQEALEIRRALAEQNPAAYLPDVAMTLNNLGLLYADTQALARADSVYQEALEIRRALAEQNPAAYLPDVAMTLNNLGLLYADTQALARADSVYQEALEIRRALAEQNPAAYLPDVAMTLNNLGVLYKNTQALARADSVYQEALSTYRALAEQNPAAYLPYVAGTLNNLGLLYADTQALARADSVYQEALEIRRALAEQNPAAYLPYVATDVEQSGEFIQ